MKNPELYDQFLRAHKNLMDSQVPFNDRLMYYRKPAWWQFKKKRALRKLLETK